jgi:hypothetical protein
MDVAVHEEDALPHSRQADCNVRGENRFSLIFHCARDQETLHVIPVLHLSKLGRENLDLFRPETTLTVERYQMLFRHRWHG